MSVDSSLASILERLGLSSVSLEQAAACERVKEQATAARGDDIVLVELCIAQHPGAWQKLSTLVSEQRAAIKRMITDSQSLDDSCARTLARLASNEADGTPRLRRYSASGPLAAWLRAVLVREAMDMLREKKGSAAANAKLSAGEGCVDTPLQVALKTELGAVVHSTLAAAMQRLTASERAWIRLRFVDGASIGQLATVMGVHRSTAARTLAVIGEKLRLAMHEVFKQQHLVSQLDVASVIRAIDGDLEGSLRSMLAQSSQANN